MKALMLGASGLGVFLCASILHSQEPPVIFRLDNAPEPTTIAELRAILKKFPTRQGTPPRDTENLPCSLPVVSYPTPNTIVKDPTSSLEIVVPGEWREIGRDNLGDQFRMPFTRYENAATWRFTVYRVATGATGASWDATPSGARLATEDCEVTNTTSGVIWAFRTEDRNGVPRYTGNGEGVSAHGRRYRFSLGAPTRAGRDSLAAFLSLSVNAGYRTANRHSIMRSTMAALRRY